MRKSTLVSLLMKASLIFMFFFLVQNESKGQVNHLVISQVYGGGGNSGTTYKNDFIEIFNPTGTTIDVSTYSVQYSSKASVSGTLSGATAITPLTGTIAPGHYYLIQEAAGAGGTTNLTSPDATGTINLSGTDGKVWLCNSTSGITIVAGGCSSSGTTVDMIGFGAANCYEGTAACAALTNTTAAIRSGAGCNDANQNSTDFSTGAPNPRNGLTTANYCYPIKLVVTTPGTQTSGTSFSVTVTSKDFGNNANNVIASTGFTLSATGATISGTTTGTISAASNSVTVSGVILTGSGTPTITATRSSGDALAAGTSGTFTLTGVSNHTVTFNNNGGSGTMTAQVASSSTALTSNTFTNTGYTFGGWNTAANGSGTAYANGASYAFTADVTLYAQWTANSNTITFTANGGTGSDYTQNINTAASANLTSNTFTRAGYTFAGWATTAGGTVAYADGASYTMGTGNVTLYAKWTANNNTITFNANGGTGTMSNQTIATAATANLTTNTFTFSGNIFTGWNTVANGSGTAYADGASYTMGTSNVTLYAQWSALSPQTITFGSLTAVTYGDAPFGLTASASSGLTVAFASSDPTIASISGSTVTILKAGSVTITASQAGNGSYSAATSVNQTLTINTKTLTVTGISVVTKTYNSTTAATLTGTAALSGIVGSDNVTLTGTAVATFVSANYSASPITVNVTGYTLSGTAASNYSITQPTLSGTINKAAAYSITSSNDSKTYGTSKTLSAFTASGLLGSDAVTSVTLTSSGAASTAVVSGSPYTISITPGSESGTGLSNYNSPTYNNTGTLTVNTATLTITANNLTRALNPYLDYTFAGTEFTTTGLISANGDAVTSVTLTSTGTEKTSTVAGSPYSIVPSSAVGSGLSNYSISYVNGTMTITNILADWTFEGVSVTATTGSSPTLSAGSFVADAGINTTGSLLSAFHASTVTTWTTPSGNGSAKAISSEHWGLGDYYQIKFSTTGYENVHVSMDQAGSATGPRDFKVQYSTDGSTFFDLAGATYSLVSGSFSNTGASQGVPNSAFTHLYDLSSITSLNDATFVYLRVVVNSTTQIGGTSGLTTAGTGRLDNLLVTGNAIRVPVNYYSNASGNLDDYHTWNTATDGTSGSTLASTGFSDGGSILNIRNANAGNLSAAWTVSGIGSKIVVDQTDFTVPSNRVVTGTIDVNAGRTLTLSNATSFPTLGNISSTSTINYKNLSGIVIPTSITYGNLVLDNTTLSSSSPATSTPLVFAGNLTLQNGGTFVNNNINLTTSGTANQTINANGGSVSIRNLESNNTIAKTGTLTLATSTTITINGSVIMNNTGAGNTFNDGANTLTVAGSLTLGGDAAGYNLSGTINLTAAAGSTAILSGNGTTVCAASLNNLNVDLIGTTINCSVYPLAGGSILTIKGNLTFGTTNTGTGTLLANGNTINIGGNYNNLRTTQVFSNTSQTVNFNSALANQTISSAVTTGETFSNLTISNLNSGGKVTANNNITISATFNQIVGNLEIVSGKTITFSSASTQTANGIIGAGNVTRTGAGTLVFTGTNTYSGTTTYSAGAINVTGSNSGSNFTVNTAASLIGTGSVSGNVTLAGTLSAGTVGTVGTLALSTTGNTFTVNGASTLTVDLTGSVSGSAGTNWDLLTLTGAINISATPTSQVNVQVTASTITGFTNSSSYSWPIITGASGVTNFDISNFNVTATGFGTIPTGYGFSLAQSGNDIVLKYGVLPIITVTGTLTNFGKVIVGSSATSQSYSVSGAGLTGDITITAPANFQIKTPITSYASSITLTPTTGTVTSTTIDVIFSPTTASGASGSLTITNTSPGATQQNVTVAGTALDVQPTAPTSISVTPSTGSITVNITPASSGAGTKRIVVVNPSTAVTFVPVNGTTYTAQTSTSIAFSSGQSVTGGRIVYNGTGSSVTVTGLNSRTTYYVSVFDFNGVTSAEDYSTATSGSALTPSGSYAYVGTGTSAWTTSSNWSPTGIPSSGDDVTFNNAATVTVTAVPASIILNTLKVTANTSVNLQSAAANTITLGQTSGTNLLTIDGGSTLTLGTNTSLTMSSNSTANVAGTLINANTLTASATGVVFNINSGGILRTTGTVTGSATTLLFNQNSTYDHNLNGGTVPTATWNNSSKVTITGCTSTVPFGLNQSFGNFDWNSTGQTGNLSISGNLTTVNGNLTMTNAGLTSHEVRLVTSNGSTPLSMTIGGNVTVANGTLAILGSGTAGTNTSTVNVTGNVTINSSGVINMNSGTNAGNSTLNIAGNLSLNGGSIIRTFGATGSNGFINLSGDLTLTSGTFSSAATNGIITLTFNKNGTQNATFNGSVLNNTAKVSEVVASTSTVNLLTDFAPSSAAALQNNGVININGHILSVSGSYTGSGLLVGSATSIVNLSSSSSTLKFSTATATSNLLNSLYLGVSGTTTLGSNLGITYRLTVGTGTTLDINGHNLTLKSSASGTAEVDQVNGIIKDGTQASPYTATNITVERYIPQGMRNYRDLVPSVANAGSVFANWQENGTGSPSSTYGVYITGKTGTPGYASFDATSGFDLTTNGNNTPSLYSCVSGTWAPIIVATGGTKGFNLDPFQGLRILVRGARNFNMGTNPSSMPTATTLRATGSLVTGTVTFNAIGSGGTVSTGGYTSSYGLTPSSSYVSGEGWSFVANPYACPVSWALIIANAGTNVGNFYCFLDPTYQNGGLQRYVTVQDNNGTITVTNRPSGITSDAACLNIQPGQGFWVYATATTPKLVIQETNKVVGGTQTTVFGTSKANMLNVSIWKDINGETTNMDEAIVSFNNNYTKSFGTEDVKKLMNGGENISITESNTDLSIDGIALPSEGDEIALKLGNVTANTAYQLKVDATQFAAPGVQAFIKDAYLNTILPAEKVINFTATTDAVTYKDRFSIVFKSAKVVPVTTMKGNISVCPNPVTEKTFVVEMSNIAAGKYNVVLVNNLGQEVMNTSINHVEGSTIESIKMNKSLTGLYTVVLRSSDGKVKYTTELLAK